MTRRRYSESRHASTSSLLHVLLEPARGGFVGGCLPALLTHLGWDATHNDHGAGDVVGLGGRARLRLARAAQSALSFGLLFRKPCSHRCRSARKASRIVSPAGRKHKCSGRLPAQPRTRRVGGPSWCSEDVGARAPDISSMRMPRPGSSALVPREDQRHEPELL